MAKQKRTILCRGSMKVLLVIETYRDPSDRKQRQELEDSFKDALIAMANSLSTENLRVSVDTWGLIIEELPTGTSVA